MASFFKNIVGKLTGTSVGPHAYLAAFGKHPGWNDHVDDMGFETDRLVAIKRLLYMEGMSANIDSGAWDKLEPDQRLAVFAHAFLWYTPADLALGRFWASRDGKGRDKYPMVACAQTTGLPLAWLLDQAAPALERVERRCTGTTSAAAVVGQLDSERAGLRERIPAAPPPLDFSITAREVAALADSPAFAPDSPGFFRILYQIQRALTAYHAGVAPTKHRRSEHLRLPRALAAPAVVEAASPLSEAPATSSAPTPAPESAPSAATVIAPAAPKAIAENPSACLSLWLRLLLAQLDVSTSLLFLLPLNEPFLDVIIGDPTTAQLFCVRAAPKSIPLTSDIPYTLDEPFLTAARKFLDACRAAPPNAPLPPLPKP